MNPAYGLWLADDDAPTRAPVRDRLARAMGVRWLANYREARVLARPTSTRPPRDPEHWLAWAKGEPVSGPRWERLTDAELRAEVGRRREERAAAEALAAREAVPVLGPWRQLPGQYRTTWIRTKPGRTTGVATVRQYGRGDWYADVHFVWLHPDGHYEHVGQFATLTAAQGAVDARLTEAGVVVVGAGAEESGRGGG